MKVLLINNFFYRKGGSEAVFYNTADLLRDSGHQVIFFSFDDEKNIHTDDNEYFIPRGGKLSQIRNFFSNPRAAKKLEDIITKERPDIAHAHLFWGGISPSIFKVLHKYNVPLVHTAHDYRMVCPAYLLKDGQGNFCEKCKGGKFYNCAIKRCSKGSVIESTLMSLEMYYRNTSHHPVNNIDGIIFVSEFSKRKHIEFDDKFDKSKTLVLYNCPSDRVNESLDTSRDNFDSYYLFYGRLSHEKGIYTLLRAVKKYPKMQLKVVGTGPLESELRNYCEEKELSNVEFLGYKTGKELYDIVAKAKYVCVPSECYENNPMTIVEAYSLGTPVIGAAIGGISEVVNEGNTGFTFKSGSVASLNEALEHAVNLNKVEYTEQRKKALVFAQNNFSRKRHLEKLLNFYEEILRK